MKTEVIEYKWTTEEEDGWTDTTYLVAIRRPGWEYRNKDGELDNTVTGFRGSYDVGSDNNTISVSSASEARAYIALLEQVAEKFDTEEAERKATKE